ncbi:MAG: DUF4386 family protein [Theionarchaea archaeon]|nr:DUF4386 family protein [Theionarchaea archaeon]MBU7038466.1 DUF4386 family protein [Theionarchaea archaeon]
MRVETRFRDSKGVNSEKDVSFRRFGAFCSAIVGFSYLVASATYLIQPSEMLYHKSEFWVFFVENSKLRLVHLVYHYDRALGALLAIAVLMVVTDILQESSSKGWLRWMSNLACIGLAVEAINNLLKVAFEISNASVFAAGDASTRAMIVAAHSWIDIDPQGIMRYTALSLWFFAISILAIRSGVFSKSLNYVGAVAGFSFLVGGPIAMSFQGYPLILSFVAITAGIGGMIFIPAWFILMGMELLKARPLYQEVNKMQPIRSMKTTG